jgi:hypothetical protein
MQHILRFARKLANAYRNTVSTGSDEPIHLPHARVYCDRALSNCWTPVPRSAIHHGAEA